MEWITGVLRANPALAVFLVIGVGFWVGKLKIKSFSLGTVTSVLLVGVLVGQLDIPISEPLKSVFFLLFLFAIGYSVGPQFFRALRGDGIKQVLFAVVVCVLVLASVYLCAKVMGYGPGEAVGLMAGAETMSACIGVGTDTINTLGADAATKQKWIDMIPVCYAVCYVFGTIGSAYLLANIGPLFLGGIEKVRQQTADLAAKMNQNKYADDPQIEPAIRRVAFRAYKIEDRSFATGLSIADTEARLLSEGKRLFVERVRDDKGRIIDDLSGATILRQGYQIVLSGRRQFIIGDESWIGPEVSDPELLDFPVMKVAILLSKKCKARTVEELRREPFMHGIAINTLANGDQAIPVLAQTPIAPGDTITVTGLECDVKEAAQALGVAERKTTASDMVFIGLGLFIGGIVGTLTVHLGGVPISLSTSGGALIAGLLLGWLRSRHPSFGYIPQPAVWLLNNMGLNTFIAVVGITAGPTFISGLKEVGLEMFLVGVVATSLPLLLAVIIGAKIFKFHPAINLGCCAGSRTTTAALGAIQEQLGSTIPAMGYTVTYAIGNTLLILWGVVIVLLVA